jgi:hypothetical protein
MLIASLISTLCWVDPSLLSKWMVNAVPAGAVSACCSKVMPSAETWTTVAAADAASEGGAEAGSDAPADAGWEAPAEAASEGVAADADGSTEADGFTVGDGVAGAYVQAAPALG